MPTERACRFEQDGNLLVITLLPELAEVPWADVEEIGTSLESRVRDRERPQVIVDLSPLAHMGSGMVALVVRIWKTAQQQGGKMAVVNDHDLVHEVLKLAGLADRWTIVGTREEARKHLDVRSAPRSVSTGTAGGGSAAPAGGGWAVAGAGIAAVVVSAAALTLMFLAPEAVPAVALKAALFAGAIAGMVLGTLALAWYLGVPRFTGVGVLVCSIALLVAGLVLVPPDAVAADPDLTDPDLTEGRASDDLLADPPAAVPPAAAPPVTAPPAVTTAVPPAPVPGVVVQGRPAAGPAIPAPASPAPVSPAPASPVVTPAADDDAGAPRNPGPGSLPAPAATSPGLPAAPAAPPRGPAGERPSDDLRDDS